MSSSPAEHQAPLNRLKNDKDLRHHFMLDVDDTYVGQCGEIYITQKRFVVFHCCLCGKRYGGLNKYLMHVSRHYAKSNHAKTTLATERTETTAKSEEDALFEEEILDNIAEDYDYLIEEEWQQEEDATHAKDDKEAIVSSDALVDVTEEPTTDACLLNAAEVIDIKIESMASVNAKKMGMNSSSIEAHTSNYLNTKGHTCAAFKRSIRKRSHTKISPAKALRYKELIKLHARMKSMSAVAAAAKDSKEQTTDKQQADVSYVRKHKCHICGFAFKEGYNLRAHLRRHTDQKHYKCTLCPKQFYTSTELNVHLRRHTGERRFTCEKCGLGFITAGSLHEHQKRHSNQRPHKCPQCDKCFYDSYLLKEHFVKHTQERNFVCETCNASFTRQKALLVHRKLHANLKEYVCNICQQGFNQRPGLKAHIRNKHKVETKLSDATHLW